jgi:hypothetical protein
MFKVRRDLESCSSDERAGAAVATMINDRVHA